MMHCPTFGSLASLKYLKTCFQKTFLKYLKTFIKCIKTLMKWLKNLSNLEWHGIGFRMPQALCPTFGSLIEHSPHLHKHTYIHNPEVDIAEGAAAAHARTREGNFWIFASEASSSSNIYLGFCQIKKRTGHLCI